MSQDVSQLVSPHEMFMCPSPLQLLGGGRGRKTSLKTLTSFVGENQLCKPKSFFGWRHKIVFHNIAKPTLKLFF